MSLVVCIVGCSTTDTAKTTQVVGSQVEMYNLITSPATASVAPIVGVYAPAVINAINPPPKVPESVNYLIVKKCGDKPCKKNHKIPRSNLPTQAQINDARAEATN